MTTPDPSADESFAAAFSPDLPVDAESSVVEPDNDADDGDDDAEPSLADYEAAAHDEEDESEPASAREARYRVRAREAEARLGTAEIHIVELEERLDVMRRAEVERIASARLADGSDIWMHGAQVDDLLDGNGDVSLAKVDQVIGELLNLRPHWGVPRPRRGGLLSGSSNNPEPRTSSWTAAFGPGQRD